MNEHVTAHHPCGPCEGDMPILAVRQGVLLEEALTLACAYLKSTSAEAAELVENRPPRWRAMARNVEHMSELVRALVEASLAGLAGRLFIKCVERPWRAVGAGLPASC